MIPIIVFGLLSGSLFAVIVGLIGRNRKIGFGWAFILSLIFTPLIGLIITLISAPRSSDESRGLGCLGNILALIGLIFLILFILAITGTIIY